MDSRVPVTVVLPTIGRPELMRGCLESLAACTPAASEIIVIDASPDDRVRDVVGEFENATIRVVACPRRGLGEAFNVGLREARHEKVLLTNDDCTVEPTWVGVGCASLDPNDGAIVTGRVRPQGDPKTVPSTIDNTTAKTHVGKPEFVLFTQCMAVRRSDVLAIGGFDGRISPSAEDNDLSYRWLRAGRVIRYEPDFVVWHHDWRTREQLERLYVGYAVGQGMMYAKHLLAGDRQIVRFVVRDVYLGARRVASRIRRGPPPWPDWRLGLWRGLPVGLVRGLFVFARRSESP